MTDIRINGQTRAVESPPDTPVLWVLRDELGMTGTKFGCGMALCGACTVHVDGTPTRSCITPLATVGSRAVTTIEALEHARVGRAVQQAWVELGVAQCGYCQAGQIMSAAGLLGANPAPSDQEIVDAMSGNICRCGAYGRINAAVRLAAERLSQEAR